MKEVGIGCLKGYGVWWIIIMVFGIVRFEYLCEGCVKEERDALLRIKDDLNYPIGSFLYNDFWVGEDCCHWYGVVCNNHTSRVIMIDLNGARGYDQMETWQVNITLFVQFKELQTLDLRYNNIGGFANSQGLCQLMNMRELDLSENQLEDCDLPSCLWNLTKLETLSLWDNKLRGDFGISTGLCQLMNLRELDLSGNQLEDGDLPSCLRNLTKLKTLSLSYNKLRGEISTGLCQLMNLRELGLSGNQLEESDLPSCLWNLTKLETLSLSNINLRGEISTGLCQLMNLRELYLFGNQLEDSDLPSCLWNLTKLETLSLSNNKLSGEISTGVWNLTNLRRLYMSNNRLEDLAFLSHLGNLSMLEELDLSYNNLKGHFSSGICNLRKLTWLDLSNNAIEGRIPPCFGQMHSLYYLSLNDNQLDGVVNLSMFANLSSLSGLSLSNNPLLEVESEGTTWEPTFQLFILDLSNCQLGEIPSFLSTQYQLEELSLSQSNLVGEIPLPLLRNITTLGRLDLSLNSFNGSFPTNFTLHFPKLFFLNMSGNVLTGPLPPFLGDSLQLVDFSNNKFFGGIPFGLASASSLVYLKLSNNRLIGEMIPTNWNMTKLRYLFLDGNEFTSTSSHGRSRNNSVVTLDVRNNFLSGAMPNWLPATFPNLESLLLGKNNFAGHIPTAYCQLQSLHLLDLSHNSLSGSIPPCFNNITSWKNEVPVDIYYSAYSLDIQSKADFTTKGNELTYEGRPLSLMTGIDLSMNQLTGKIPSELGSLKCLHSLNLSHNLLTGPIPESFKNMEQLESLDLSHNKLIGPIPQQLTQIHRLSTFTVSFNNLSGPIPFEKQFSTFEESSYTGNTDLCGKPVKKSCSFKNSSEPGNTGEEDENDDESIMDNPMIFYSFVAMSFALGFWGFIALLIFKKTWRFKYFTVMDGYINTWEEKVSGFLCRLKICFCNS